MTQCSATTKKGDRCRKQVERDGLCRTHLGQVKRSTLTKERADRIVATVQRGVPPDAVVRALGIPSSTFYDWLKERRTADGDDLPLVERIDEAKAKGEMALIDVIVEAGEKDWRAANRALVLLNPDRYAQQSAGPASAEPEVPDGPTDQAGL